MNRYHHQGGSLPCSATARSGQKNAPKHQCSYTIAPKIPSVPGPKAMNDHAFALAILDNVVQDESWCSFLSSFQSKVSDYNVCDPPKSIVSIEFVTAIHEEYWFRYRNNPQCNSYMFSACLKADKCHRPPSFTTKGTCGGVKGEPRRWTRGMP